MNAYEIEKTSKILELLIEAVQGPCKMNQKFLGATSECVRICRMLVDKFPGNLFKPGKNCLYDTVCLQTRACEVLSSIMEGGEDLAVRTGIRDSLDSDVYRDFFL